MNYQEMWNELKGDLKSIHRLDGAIPVFDPVSKDNKSSCVLEDVIRRMEQREKFVDKSITSIPVKMLENFIDGVYSGDIGDGTISCLLKELKSLTTVCKV